MPRAVDSSETTEFERTRRTRRIAVISVDHFGGPRTDRSGHLSHRIRDFVAHDRVTGGPSADKLIMVTSRYPFAAATKTRSDWQGGHDAKPLD
jgi:hypothetical protein